MISYFLLFPGLSAPLLPISSSVSINSLLFYWENKSNQKRMWTCLHCQACQPTCMHYVFPSSIRHSVNTSAPTLNLISALAIVTFTYTITFYCSAESFPKLYKHSVIYPTLIENYLDPTFHPSYYTYLWFLLQQNSRVTISTLFPPLFLEPTPRRFYINFTVAS